jgi:hypothetical protein
MAKPSNPDPRSGVDYEKLGRAVESALVRDYVELLASTRRQIWSAFVRGIFMGFGSVVGATVVVALVLWLLHTLGGLPVVGQYLQGAGDTIQHK